MITINLLPVREERRKAEAVNHAIIAAACIIVAVIGVFLYNRNLNQQIDNRRAQVASLEKQSEKYKTQLKEVDQFKKKKKSIQAKLDVIEKLNQSRSGPVRILDELATRTPKPVWIKSFTSSKGSMELKGVGINNEAVAGYLTALEDSEYFSHVTLETIKRTSLKGLKVSNFEIHAELTTPTKKSADANPTSASVDHGRNEISG